MAIRLHGFLSSPKRFIQIESQPHHITAIFKRILHFQCLHRCEFADVHNAYYECEADGTITFYQAKKDEACEPGIWTYLVYECLEGKEIIFRDAFSNKNTNSLQLLLAGFRLPQVAVNIDEYLKYKDNECEYLDIQLPDDWNNQLGREIADLLLEEVKAFKTSSVFAEDVGKKYMQATLDGFIQVAREILVKNGTAKDFESAQYDVLNKIQIDDIANLIIAYNDYRIWQAALPSKSKAVEFAFNTALSLICRLK
ncbi:hypothetical protein [Nostoc sp. 106C]|uniref:hypothetical protein n=1 Tax=Nostoc sp. 106C TaxID=1932667 RepID=UPI000A3910B0|nr:hypothetical protein [Nostoc sp. 106C]OUL34902.1 hypothetical protein BV375_03090 [Nostoc sp. 106C]